VRNGGPLLALLFAASGCAERGATEWYALDLGDRTVGVEERRVTPTSDGGADVVRRWRVAGGAGEATAHVGPGETLQVDLGPLVARRVDAPPDLPDDLNALLSVPVGPIEGARSARSVSFVVSGAEIAERPPLQAVSPWPRASSPGGSITVTVPIALEVPSDLRKQVESWIAASGEGDCQARSDALVALAEAEGVDATVLVGLVYLESEGPGLYPHAWVEIPSPYGPFWADPTLGQPVADASRLVLAEDGPDAPVTVLRALSTIAVTSVDRR
jgi:hypothetical protein